MKINQNLQTGVTVKSFTFLLLFLPLTLVSQEKTQSILQVKFIDQPGFASASLFAKKILDNLPDSSVVQITFIVGPDKRTGGEVLVQFAPMEAEKIIETDQMIQAILPKGKAEASWRIGEAQVIVGAPSKVWKVFSK